MQSTDSIFSNQDNGSPSFAQLTILFVYFDWQVKDATRGVEWAAVPGAECMLLSSAGVFLRTAKSLTNFYGVAIIEDVQPGYYQVGAQI